MLGLTGAGGGLVMVGGLSPGWLGQQRRCGGRSAPHQHPPPVMPKQPGCYTWGWWQLSSALLVRTRR